MPKIPNFAQNTEFSENWWDIKKSRVRDVNDNNGVFTYNKMFKIF